MPASGRSGRGAVRPGELRRLRRAFETVLRAPAPERRAAAERRFADEPRMLRDLLALLDCSDARGDFLEPPSTRSAQLAAAQEPDAAPGLVLGGRWQLVRRIGSGGQGVVWEASDRTAGGRAAVKLLRRGGNAGGRGFGREAAALRWLQLPGVVRLLDDGIDDGVAWIAMELVAGRPFPGQGRAGRWERVEPVATLLLESLARVHAAGVVHGDLKPRNVLVGPGGAVTLLDLGLATALGGGPDERAPGGTPGYAAPERRRGTPPDVRSDLYSAGVLLFRAVCGRHPGADAGAALRDAGVPARARRLVSRLLASRPDGRPESASEALARLHPPRRARRRRPWTRAELRARFAGHDWFHHLREDAARELFRRTRGEAGAVEDELASWLRAGLARMEGDLVAVDRPALERLALLPATGGARRGRTALRGAGRDDAALDAAVRARDPGRIVRAAVRVARTAIAHGRSDHALSAIELACASAAGRGTQAALRRALPLAASAALGSASARNVERALWLVQRCAPSDEFGTALRDVLRAAAALQAGDRATAWRLSSRTARTAPGTVRRLAWSVRALVAQGLDLDVHRRTVAEGARWASRDGTASARGAAMSWRAWLSYRQGRCAEAMRLHLACARAASAPAERSRFLVDAAVAALDAGETGEAVRLARAARRVAARLRLPVREARAYFTEREAGSREGDWDRLDDRVLRAVDELGFGVLTRTARRVESVRAWRRGDADAAREILGALGPDPDPDRLAYYEVPVACLRTALGTRPDTRRALALGSRAVNAAAPAAAVQCLALLAIGAPEARATLRRLVPRTGLWSAGREFTRVREFLSIEQALSVLGAP